jgi:OOP family OmpA-OmpF porin
MVHASLLPYTFLIVGHIEANGKREPNVTLSQRRADAIRDILVNTFKISAKRLQSIGLGEEQLLDPSRPTAAVNQQVQIFTVAKAQEEVAAPAAPSTPAAAVAKKRRK